MSAISRPISRSSTPPVGVSQVGKAAFSLCCALILTCLLIVISGMGWDAWYSTHLPYRLQTEALLEGRLSLADTPHGLEPDYMWGNGVQQGWGLGVPLLRLPFELLARLFGFSIFPDRITFLIYYFLSAAAISYAISDRLKWLERSRTTVLGLAAVFSVCMMLRPEFLGLITGKFTVYEECVAYGVLWTQLVSALILLAAVNDKPLYWISVMLLSGVGVWIRPTMFMYGVAGALVAGVMLVHRYKLSRFKLAFLALGWGTPATILLYVNLARFGSVWEFGYSLNVSTTALNVYALRFSFPFAHESIVSAARELIAAMFLVMKANGNDFYQNGIDPWFSETLRFREIYFPCFGVFDLFLLIAGALIGALIFFNFRQRLLRRDRAAASNNSESSFLLWGLLSFCLLFVFYLRSPSITSRYLSDFSAAISAIEFAVAIFCIKRFGWIALWIVPSIWVLGVLSQVLFPRFEHSYPLHESADYGEVLSAGPSVTFRDIEPLSEAYSCPVNAKGVFCNLCGINRNTDCKVSVASTVFLPPSDCIELTYTVDRSWETRGAEISPRVKSGLEELIKIRSSKTHETVTNIYCSRYRYTQLNRFASMISIAWPDELNLSRFIKEEPVTLVRIGVHRQSPAG